MLNDVFLVSTDLVLDDWFINKAPKAVVNIDAVQMRTRVAVRHSV